MTSNRFAGQPHMYPKGDNRRSQGPLIPNSSGTTTAPTPDPINPYAVVALVAALVGLFPVAIVFGILALGRATGRGLAIAALVIGVIEALAIGIVAYSASTAFHLSDTSPTKFSSAHAIGDQCNFSSDSHTNAADGTRLVCRYAPDGASYWFIAPSAG